MDGVFLMASKKPTITQVANMAGVSVATVSRVINHKGIVKEETLQKVIDVMQQLGVEFDQYPEKPETTTGLIVINLPSIENPFYSEIIKGAESAARRYGYMLLINQQHINGHEYERLIELIRNVKVSGLITLNHIPTELVQSLDAEVPLVQCCEYDEDSDVSYVSIDDLAATRTVMDYILSTGRRRVAFMTGPLRYKYSRHRKQGYIQALRSAGIEPLNNWIIQLPEINFDIALSAATQLLKSPNPPDAFFAVSDVFAAAIIKAARRAGLKVPQDLIVVGFDNVNISVTSHPSITTVNQPKFQLGYMAVELLVERMQNQSAPQHHILLNTELIIRESTMIDQRLPVAPAAGVALETQPQA